MHKPTNDNGAGLPPMYHGPNKEIKIIAPFFHGTFEKENPDVLNSYVFDASEGINSDIDYSFEPQAAVSSRVIQNWDSVLLRWDACQPGTEAGTLLTRVNARLDGYADFIACLTTSREVEVRLALKIDGAWTDPERHISKGKRTEFIRPVHGDRIQEVCLSFVAVEPGQTNVTLSWFGLLKSGCSLSKFGQFGLYDESWPGLIKNSSEWGTVNFAQGLLFDESLLNSLREKRHLPYWQQHYEVLKRSAEATMRKEPEQLIGWTVPWSDGRYMLSHEVSVDLFFYEPLTLGIVGLVEGDQGMQRMAIRYLMCFLFTEHWCPSENLVEGATWDQRCFQEELSATTVALLADWFDFALTDHAKELVCRSLWKKGLSVIEGDLMKYDYMRVINQGAWFCRARILGGLMLEKRWPRMGGYVERAYQDMIEILERYILPDGGTDEGVGYFSLTLSVCLEGIIAYARAKSLPVASCLPEGIEKCESFVATLSGMKPGTTLMDGDNSFDRFVGNAVPLLAGIYPESVYADILGGLLGHPKPDTYFSQYLPDMELSFVLGPDEVKEPRTIVPTFNILENTGHLTSLRRVQDLAVRMHLCGAKAFASHTHFDKGAFTLEVGMQPIFIDRGVVRYDDANTHLLKNTELHNVATPIHENGSYIRQSPVTEATIPEGRGDEVSLDCSIDLRNVWRGVMHDCRRQIISDHPFEFTVIDQGTLMAQRQMAFHLHSIHPFEIKGNQATLCTPECTVEITFGYAEELCVYEELFDYAYRPVNHLVAKAPSGEAFELVTEFKIIKRV